MKEINLSELLGGADTEKFRPVAFWSLNSELGEDELRRQIREMKSYGLGGFVLHARAGLKTEYLSEEWFYYTGVCLEEAKKLRMQVWIYDEFGWPSGFAGGKLLAQKENRARYLEYKILDRFDGTAYAVYSVRGGEAKLLSSGDMAEKYHTLYLRYSDAYADILNPDVTEKFISATHEKYYGRFASSFGRELAGFFTDEPQYYRYAAPISAVTESEYFAAYGENMKEGLLYLFLQSEKGYPFRVKYYNLMNRLYCENFYGKLYDWCDRHGCMLTGHSVEETNFYTQMWGGADCASSYLYEHIPAIDNLCRSSSASISAKNAASVAAQTDKQFVMTETFGCSGYGATVRELCNIAEKQYVCGVNLMCQHLYNYSLAGQGKIDHPISFGRTLPWIDGYKAFNDYFARLGYFIANSHEEAPVAVITPMESVYLDYLRLDESASIKSVDEGFAEILDELRKNGIAYHFVNEKVLEKTGAARGGKLIAGARAYSAVVVANCRELKKNTVKLLREFLRGGGKLNVSGSLPRYVDGVKTDLSDIAGNTEIGALPKPMDIAMDKAMDFTVRSYDGKRFLFAVNDSSEDARINGNITVAARSSVLLADGKACVAPKISECVTLAPEFVRSDENTLTIENVSVALENGDVLSGYVYGVFETLVKRGYEGKISVEYSFASDCARNITLTMEKCDAYDIRFNGEEAEFTQDASDINFVSARLVATKGNNVLRYDADLSHTQEIRRVMFDPSVPESLRNCLSYTAPMEPMYIVGEFDTDGYTLVSPRAKAAGDLTATGFENFCGYVTYAVRLPHGGKARIEPIGDYATCELRCGGESAVILAEKFVEMQIPENGTRMEIKCYSTMRNKFGPFHCKGFTEDSVSPDSFTLRGKWRAERRNENYSADRKTVPFGLREVRVKYLST